MIKPVGSKYQVYGYRAGRKHYVGTYRSKDEAFEAEENFRVTTRKIRDGLLPPDIDQRRSVDTGITAWLKSLKDAGQKSHDEYENRCALYITPKLGALSIVDVTRARVLAWRDELAQSVHNNTANTVLMTLSSAFTYFVERGWLDVNPCRGIKQLPSDPRVFPWLESPEAITRLLAELPWKWQSLCAFIVGTGCRLDEALRLTWDDVDLEHRLVTFRKTKAGKPRRVPIFDSVLPVLKQMKLQRGKETLLWPGPKGKLAQPSVRKPFKAAVERAGLPEELRIHDLRHTFASLFLADGGDIFKLSRILGHHSVLVTERTYAHLKKDAFEGDYGRVAFRMPTECRVTEFVPGRGHVPVETGKKFGLVAESA
jgi:integrase